MISIDNSKIISQQNSPSSNDLQMAIRDNKPRLALAALSHGTLWKEKLPNGHSPLVYAIRLGRHEIVQRLSEIESIDVSEKDSSGLSPLDHASISGDPRMLSILLSSIVGKAAEQAASGNFKGAEIFQEISKEMALYRTPDLFDGSPLHRAAFTGDIAEMEKHLQFFSVNQTDVKGWTPLHYASLSGKPDAVKWLLAKNAKASIQAKDGKTPLHLAAISGAQQIVELLLNEKVPLDAVDHKGRTPLHYAAGKDSLRTLSLLIKSGADPLNRNLRATPLEILTAQIHTQAAHRDPLKTDWSSTFLSACVFGSWMCRLAGQNDLGDALDFLTVPASLAMIIKKSPNWSQPIGYSIRCVILELLSEKLGQRALLWGQTFFIGREAIRGLSNCWGMRHLETWRPLRNSFIHLTTGAGAMTRLFGPFFPSRPTPNHPPGSPTPATPWSCLSKTGSSQCDIKDKYCIETMGSCMDLFKEESYYKLTFAQKILGADRPTFRKNYREGALMYTLRQ